MSPIEAFGIGVFTVIICIGIAAALAAWLDNKPMPKLDLDKAYKDALTVQKCLRTLRNEVILGLVSLITTKFPSSGVRTKWDGHKCTVYIRARDEYKEFTITFGDTDVTLPKGEVDKLMDQLATLRLDLEEKE